VLHNYETDDAVIQARAADQNDGTGTPDRILDAGRVIEPVKRSHVMATAAGRRGDQLAGATARISGEDQSHRGPPAR
jgi:hypothetical protein